MLPIVAIVGRPNVGKSTLFNCLTRARAALVADVAGLTRDRHYDEGRIGDKAFLLIDTGGFTYAGDGIAQHVDTQAELALQEADFVLFMVDAQSGVHPDDQRIAQRLRQLQKPIILLANKVDGLDPDIVTADFHALALGEPKPLAVAHRRGVNALKEQLSELLPDSVESENKKAIHIAIVGRPNVGKSTLVNRLLGEERVVVYDAPGTTRDSILVPLTHREQEYMLIDTAGIRRRYKSGEAVEQFSVTKSLQAIKMAHVAILVIDAQTNIVDKDLDLLDFILQTGKALVIVVNKWDGLSDDDKDRVRSELSRRLQFIDFAKPHRISALHGTGVGDLFKLIHKAYDSAMCDLPTARLNEILQAAVQAHQPPLVHGRRIKLRYAHAGGHNPPTIVIHGKQTKSLPDAYVRYLANTYRKALQITGSPVRIELRTDDNPFAGRKNTLTERQQRKRKRLIKHVKKRAK